MCLLWSLGIVAWLEPKVQERGGPGSSLGCPYDVVDPKTYDPREGYTVSHSEMKGKDGTCFERDGGSLCLELEWKSLSS